MSIDPAIAVVWDVLKMGFAPIKRGFGYVMSSKSYANNLQQEVRNLEFEAQKVRSAEGAARANLQNIHDWVPNFLASAEKASEDAKELLGRFEAASKTCCRGTIPDPNCRYQFSRKAKSKTDDIQKLIRENKDKDISFSDPASGNVAARYADELRKEVKNLEYEAARVHNAAKEATNNLRNTHEWVEKFLASAEAALREARGLLGEFEEASKTWCRGTLPDLNCLDQFSRKAKHMTDDIKNLILENSNKEISFSGPARREGNDATASVLSASMSVKLRDRGVFKSRASTIQNIMDALADNSKSVVGVYGMGGVGKSTLLDDVKRILIEERSFDSVAKADVSKNPNIHTIQGDIADALGLIDIKNKETIGARAELLHGRLKEEESNKKKVLIILDNLWEKLDLKLVGIPCGHDNKATGCKLLLTSRDQRLLQREMGCDREFFLGELKKEEARALFERTAGDKVHDNEFKAGVEAVLRRCAGVPFLIVAMGKLLKYADLYEWRDALRKMEKFNHREINGLIDQMLQWSYDRLEGEAKSLLRLCVVCSVFKPSLENLVRYGFGLGLFQEVSSMEEARDRLHTHIRALQASALLLDSEDVGGFKIHDLVREFVASVSSRDQHPLLVLEDKVESVTELQENKLESCEAMCFPNMKELPPELNCPELRILLMATNYKSLHIPDSYFNSMRNLMVLNLAGVRLTRSPSPFQLLANVHTLCFQNCSFEDVAILGNLKRLQILSIVNSKIQRLPKEIGQLVELRSLDLSDCPELEIIEPGVLQSLTNLEELLLVAKDIQMIQNGKFPDDIFGKPKALTLACFHDEKATFPPGFLLERFQNMESLEIFRSSFEDIFPCGGIANEGKHPVLESLRELKLSKLDKLKRVWREDCSVSKILLSIETLEVRDCPELTILFPAVTSFMNLTKLVVKNSSGLIHLGTASEIASLVHLKEMTIIGCERIKEVVTDDENEKGQVISFRKLQELTLKNMPSLECFSSTTSCILSFPSLFRIEVEECPKMKIFSKGTLSTPKLDWGTLFGYDWQCYWEWEGDLNTVIQKLSA
ncbi:putative disease resistance protein At5g05400 [Rhodamnia argentea]|uniref:Disease resistance protein At5g05400 n=1 Tax=Rhodamnia argentea TaxID=178133 RepID=A0ABM3HGJ1_9MYRT|nr:putative disease resistance protein At5g05400 [Rhodamnia argentea]